MTRDELKEYLDFKAEQYESPSFIESDPIQLPHRFDRKEDIEIVAFLVSSISWGQRKTIIKNGERLIGIMENDPYNFILNYQSKSYNFVHRTFNS